MAAYRELMRALAQAQARYDDEVAQVQQQFEQRCAAAATTAEEARVAAATTAAGARAAAQILDHVDIEAAGLWQAVRNRAPSRLRRRLGFPPEPAAPDDLVEPPPSDEPDGDPAEPAAIRHLALATEVVARGRKRGPLPRAAYALLPLLGVLAAALAYGAARGMLLFGDTLHGPPGTVVTAVGQIATFAAPLAGLPAAKVYADRRGARLDAGAIGLVVLAGMIAVATLTLWRPLG
jgi:hypothetical protein